MSLPTINLDDRTYQQILDEALARVPVHNPEWTNFNDSDPGVTILQLFAFMTESIIYRANRIPERNRLKLWKVVQGKVPSVLIPSSTNMMSACLGSAGTVRPAVASSLGAKKYAC